MERYKYLIIGGDMTRDAAVRGIQELDSAGSIGILSGEAVEPYDRPPLSKGLWKHRTNRKESRFGSVSTRSSA